MNEAMEKGTLVQCKETGIWYDPYVEFEKLMAQEEVVAIMKRLKDR